MTVRGRARWLQTSGALASVARDDEAGVRPAAQRAILEAGPRWRLLAGFGLAGRVGPRTSRPRPRAGGVAPPLPFARVSVGGLAPPDHGAVIGNRALWPSGTPRTNGGAPWPSDERSRARVTTNEGRVARPLVGLMEARV